MEGLILLAQGLPYFTEISTVITVSSIITMALKDKYAEKLPILKTIWPIINWLSLNVFHNQNNSEGMQKDKKKK
tara:strand:+ start:349 stop:570 length:222 start_codon:yes stop_codon:yes gene_type:complete